MSLKKNIIANYLGQGWVALMGFTFIPFYIKYLGIEAYGLIGFYTTIVTALLVLDFGIISTITRQMSLICSLYKLEQELKILQLLRTCEIILLVFGIIIFILFYLTSDWISDKWITSSNIDTNQVSFVVKIVGSIVIFRFIEALYQGVLVGLQKQVILNVYNVVSTTFRAGGVILFLEYYSPTLDAFFYWQLTSSIIGLIFLIFIVYQAFPSKNLLKAKPSLTVLRSTKNFTISVFIIQTLGFILGYFDKIILSGLLTLKEFAYYMIAINIASVVYIVVSPANLSWYPKLCQYYASNHVNKLIISYHMFSQYICVIAGCLAITIFWFSSDIVMLWTSDLEIASSSSILLSIIVLGNFFNALLSPPYRLQLANGTTNLSLFVNLGMLLFYIPALLYITPKYGTLGVGVLWITVNLLILFIVINVMHKTILTSEKSKWIIQDTLVPLASLFITSLILFSLIRLISIENKIGQIILIITSLIITFIISSISSNYLRDFFFLFLKRKSII